MTRIAIATLALLVLATVSFLSGLWWLALAIAVVKAAIVVSVFMEVREVGAMGRIVVLVVGVFVALLAAGVVADVELR